ncbi:Putative intracellular protease/amidase [Pseudobutyrivibrio sp. JW11]|uniref:DJ-1/PfpI family protein n=1 Tax=Pseudobutyrivibrio sp. JW11 TaxID=1855302 RepID=UPI0008E94863|nr:DJ-1/PfpI family protein [Pseudobutyrivibrio sp. JW11]SFO13601.1 Putative intracellular protease/amidase [Pseudobutyrivibrio sp. JW11]
MKTVVLLYETCCIYEIVITNYFLQCTGHEIVFATVDGKSVTAQEKFSLNATCALREIDPKDVELLLVPGGDISTIDNEEVYSFIRSVVDNKGIVAGICNGVDELDKAGVLKGIESTHSVKDDLVVGEYVITAKANMYVDMAIAIGKKMNLFVDEADLQETIDFWKLHKTF